MNYRFSMTAQLVLQLISNGTIFYFFLPFRFLSSFAVFFCFPRLSPVCPLFPPSCPSFPPFWLLFCAPAHLFPPSSLSLPRFVPDSPPRVPALPPGLVLCFRRLLSRPRAPFLAPVVLPAARCFFSPFRTGPPVHPCPQALFLVFSPALSLRLLGFPPPCPFWFFSFSPAFFRRSPFRAHSAIHLPLAPFPALDVRSFAPSSSTSVCFPPRFSSLFSGPFC